MTNRCGVDFKVCGRLLIVRTNSFIYCLSWIHYIKYLIIAVPFNM